MLNKSVGLGAYPFSNPFTPVDPNDAKRIVFRFLDLGGRYIQTAPYYKNGEELLGELLKEIPRQDYELSTLTVKNREGIRSGTYQSIISQCEDSLKVLGVDYVDYYMPSTTKATDSTLAETMEALVDLKKDGKVKHIGVCNVALDQLKEFNQTGNVEIVQNRFSLLNQSSSREIVDYCRLNNIKLIPWGIIERGLLTDKILTTQFEFGENDVRSLKPEFRQDAINLLKNWAEKYLSKIAQDHNCTIESIIIKWTLMQPHVLIALVGATSTEQVENNHQAVNLDLTEDSIGSIDLAYKELETQIFQLCGKNIQEYLQNVYRTANH